ncbi:hypothetical protein TM1040_1648 [Ruegeria sp. TM1040]|nr:hypothetical protein TM1040_1648 [Ruegeria sp. TM1040]
MHRGGISGVFKFRGQRADLVGVHTVPRIAEFHAVMRRLHKASVEVLPGLCGRSPFAIHDLVSITVQDALRDVVPSDILADELPRHRVIVAQFFKAFCWCHVASGGF